MYTNAIDRGIAHSVKAHQIPVASRVAKGSPLPQVLNIAGDETITTVLPVETISTSTNAASATAVSSGAGGIDEEVYLLLLTSFGYMKKTPLKAFKNISARGLIIITLGECCHSYNC